MIFMPAQKPTPYISELSTRTTSPSNLSLEETIEDMNESEVDWTTGVEQQLIAALG